jgi:hypothetical protein
MFLKLSLSTMIRNIKIENIIDIIIISNLMGNVFSNKLMKRFLEIFPIFFQSSMGLIKFIVMFFVGPPNHTSTQPWLHTI